MNAKRLAGLAAAAVICCSPLQAQEPDFPQYPGPAGWTVSVDPMREAFDAMNQNARNTSAPFHVEGVDFEITRDSGPERSFEDRKILLEYWALQIANLLEEEDFISAEDDEFEKLMGMTKAQFRQMMLSRIPYGFRDTVTEQFSEGFYVMILESPPGCPGDNGYAALVVPQYPVQDVDTEYGQIGLFLIGAGDCASRGSSRQRLRRIVETVQSSVVGR